GLLGESLEMVGSPSAPLSRKRLTFLDPALNSDKTCSYSPLSPPHTVSKSAGWFLLNAFVSPEPRCRLSPRQEIHFCPFVRSLNCSASSPHPASTSAGWFRLNHDKPLKLLRKMGARY